MATKTKGKDVRSLMKDKLNKSKKKIDSPLARYNNAGQLFCVLCNTILKSDLLWDAHIRGTKHKENLITLKSGQSKSQPNIIKNKRKNEHTNDSLLSSETPAVKKTRASSPPAKSSIPADFFDKDVTRSIDDQEMATEVDTSSTSASLPSTSSVNNAVLPTDFFDEPSTEKDEMEDGHSSTEKQPDKSDSIPEGFFDDPKLDAKARKVEYKDPAEEEWEKFQKALSTENQVSEAIIYEEEEESRIDRALDEISEQRLYYIRADALRDKQSTFKKIRDEKRDQGKTSKMTEESDSDSDDMEAMFNWRAKKAL